MPFVPISTAAYQQSLLERIQAAFPGAVEVEEGSTMFEEVPFSVTEEYSLGDLSEVKEDRVVLPVSSRVKLGIRQASSRTNKDGSITSLNVQVALLEGVEVPEKDMQGGFTGQLVRKYQGKTDFLELTYKVDTTIRNSAWWTSKNRPWLLPLRQFLMALGYPINPAPPISDDLCSALKGREILADIINEEITQKNPITGKREGTGEYRHRFKRFQSA